VTTEPGGPVIGLEIHVQLRTPGKLFCRCAAEYGAEPNTRVCEICLGLPGALPVLDRGAVELAVRTAVALGCTIQELSSFARKHYFYPDLPKGYQITQREHPLATRGSLTFAGEDGVPRTVEFRGLHLEEDSARSLHRAGVGTLLDFNRAGIPLLEIVSEPRLRSAGDARAMLIALKRVLEYLEVSDCNMEEGSLRVDANISLAGADGRPGARTEIKNLNSFSAVERALHFETDRLRGMEGARAEGERATRLWDVAGGVTRPLRGKEEIADYRYLPEPDLPPVRVTAEQIAAVRREIPELPDARAVRLAEQHALPPVRAEVIARSRSLADRFEATVAAGIEAHLAANWLLGEELAMGADEPPAVAELVALLRALQSGTLTRSQAREAAGEMHRRGIGAEEAIGALQAKRETDGERLQEWARAVVEAYPSEVRRFRDGDRRLLHFFIGQAMGRSRGSADPAALEATLLRLLADDTRV
jgi:aspartyl-tRNA(Asn)/glutamyl-tRNA(Gln) amidotransferase subunit B